MTVLRVQVSLESASGLPEDAAMNVWHFNSASDHVGDAEEIHNTLDTFYNAIAEIYSTNTITGNVDVKVFDLVDVPPRVPIFTDTFEMVGLGEADALPTECAICLSYQAEPESGINQRRRRGRFFLGPLDAGTSTTAAGLVRVTTAATILIGEEANVVRNAGNLLTTFKWVTFSPTSAGTPPWTLGELAGAAAVVDNGWVDNAFDTQRRRGTNPDTRTLWGG